jgi:hypothetical protein
MVERRVALASAINQRSRGYVANNDIARSTHGVRVRR